jgi:hypothetical protein
VVEPTNFGRSAYLVVFLVLVIIIPFVFIIVIIVLEVVLVVVIKSVLELQCFSGKPIDGPRNELLLDVLSELVVQLELGFKLVIDVLIVLIGRWCGRVEEIEE